VESNSAVIDLAGLGNLGNQFIGVARPAPEPPVEAVPVSDAVFEALVETHYARTYSFIYRMVQSEPDAADLTQETFVRVYKALPRLRAEGALFAWIRRIASNLCMDYLRRRNSSLPTFSLDARVSEESDTMLSWDIADPTAEPQSLFASRERKNVLYRAIQTLPEEYRAVIVMHHIEEMRVEDIAGALGVPAGTIKSRLSRARRELRRKLSPYFDPNMVRP
jgi:RNA polymerase sigma-70 factor, ECF subfamily